MKISPYAKEATFNLNPIIQSSHHCSSREKTKIAMNDEINEHITFSYSPLSVIKSKVPGSNIKDSELNAERAGEQRKESQTGVPPTPSRRKLITF